MAHSLTPNLRRVAATPLSFSATSLSPPCVQMPDMTKSVTVLDDIIFAPTSATRTR